jgi:hypothetical protein
VINEGQLFGRRWVITYLRYRFSYRARQLNIANIFKLLNFKGVARRTPDLRKKRLKNYVTAGPDYLWCLDGHDKLA